MKLFKLAPVAGLLLASSAFAVEPAADIKIFAAGASAQLNTISGILTSLCKPNGGGSQIQFYQGFGTSTGGTSATAANSNLRAFRCEIANNATSPGLNGKTVLFVYSAIDGSASGVQYVARQLPRKFLNFDACPTAPLSVQTVATSVTPAGSAQFNCTGTGVGATSTTTTQDRVPTAGASDVEPARFSGDNAPPGETSINGSDLAKLAVKPSRAVIFGVYGNSALWLALQKRQGLIPTSATAPIMPFTTTTVSATNGLTNVPNPDFTESLRPNISKAEYRGIAEGFLNDMQFLRGTNTPVPGTVTGGELQLARRVNGSGTQAMSNIFFLNNSCGVLTSSSLVPADTSFTGGNFFVTEGSGTSNVISELQKSATRATVGVISLENPSRGAYTLNLIPGNTDVTPKAAYAALKLNGITPNRANAINGSYEFFAEETFQWNTNVIAPGSLAETFLERFTDAGATVATLQTLNSATQEGSAALPQFNGGSPALNTAWIMNSTREGNNCKPASKVHE
jgi:hypothetical protein